MQIQFIGAARTVTGSMHLLQTKKSRVLLDCGLFEGRRRKAYETNWSQAQLGAEAEALVLSHAHMDHSGNIPSLVKAGFDGNVWATAATRDLCAAMLRDSAHIQEQDIAYLNKHRKRRGQPLLEPLYTTDDADRSIDHFVGVAYGRPFHVTSDIRATFLDAGHILGSALTLLEISENGRTVRLGYTGDLGRKGLPILRDPQQMENLDYLIIESTYGDRVNEAPHEARSRLRKVINDTYKRGGKVIIPSFAVGRTQEAIYDLYLLTKERKIPRMPIYVDSPLAVDATEIFRLHRECYDREMLALLEESRFGPLGFNQVTYVRHVEDSKSLNFLREPAIIISASGMAEAGRILHHLKNNIEDERNTILFIGYQAENTLGRRIKDGARKVRIFDNEYVVRAHVESIEGYSAHADRDDLLAYVDAVARTSELRGIFVVHGEENAILSFTQALRERGFTNVRAPKPKDKVTL